MPNKFRSHSESLSVLCTVCFSKGKDLRNISANIEELVKEFAIPYFDRNDLLCPTSICDLCRKSLSKIAKGEDNLLNIFDRSMLDVMPKFTRQQNSGDQQCYCSICDMARGNLNVKQGFKKPVGRPKNDENK